MKISTILTLLATGASANLKSYELTDTFDKPPNYNPVLPFLSPVGSTAGGALAYPGFYYTDLTVTKSTLAANTPPFAVGAGLTGKVLSGAPGFGPINSTVKYVTPKSLYYACQLYDATGKPAIATPCTFQAKGIRYGTGAAVTQDFVYNPKVILPLGNKFTKGTFSAEFQKVTNVTFSIVGLTGTALVLDIDTNSYTAYIER